jgi:hypothetical protein
MSNLYRGPSIDASYQVSVYLAKQFQKRIFFRNRPIRHKNSLWQPCLLTDQDEMCNLYWGPSIDASYQVSVHLAQRLQRRRFFRNWPFRNKNCLWWPFLLTNRDKMDTLYRGSSIHTSYQVSVHLAKWFQEKNWKKLTNQKQELPVAAMFVNGSGRNMHLYKGPSIDAFYKVSVHLAKRLPSSRFCRNWPIRNKNCLWWPFLLTN